MANLADTVLDIQSKLVALQAAVAALPTTSGGGSVDLSPVTAAVANVQSTVDAIKVELTPSQPVA